MTLVLTRLTEHGIAMAADSAVTSFDKAQSKTTVTPSATQKLFELQGLAAGVSCWGRGTIDSVNTSEWLQAFIEEKTGDWPSIAEFSIDLARRLREVIPRNPSGQFSLGFHVAGFDRERGRHMPTFFHVHDGPSVYFPNCDPQIVNAHHDCPPEFLARVFASGRIQEMRNGEFRPYALIRQFLGSAFDLLNAAGWPSIKLPALDSVSRYNLLEIRLMSEIYSLSGSPPVIGGRIDWLTIDNNGNVGKGDVPNYGGVDSPGRPGPAQIVPNPANGPREPHSTGMPFAPTSDTHPGSGNLA